MYHSRIMTIGCPNCLIPVHGIQDEDGFVRICCPNCGTLMVVRKISRRKAVIEINAPSGQVALF